MFELRRSAVNLFNFFCANPSAWLFFSHCKAVESIKSDKEGGVGSDGSSKRLQSFIFHRKWRILCDGPKGGNFWKTLLEEKGSEKVQEGGRSVCWPQMTSIFKTRGAPMQAANRKNVQNILRKRIIITIRLKVRIHLFQNQKSFFFYWISKTFQICFFFYEHLNCAMHRDLFWSTKEDPNKTYLGKKRRTVFFPAAAADQVDGWAVTGQCPLMVTVKSEQKTTRGLGETNKTIEISYMSSQDRMYLVSSTLACQRYKIQFLSICLCIIYVLCW